MKYAIKNGDCYPEGTYHWLSKKLVGLKTYDSVGAACAHAWRKGDSIVEIIPTICLEPVEGCEVIPPLQKDICPGY